VRECTSQIEYHSRSAPAGQQIAWLEHFLLSRSEAEELEHFAVSIQQLVSQPTFALARITSSLSCHNPSFGLATKAKGVARLRAKRKEARESRQRHCKSAGQEEARELSQEKARELRQEEARESHHILPGV
jgi:hypothetical protein